MPDPDRNQNCGVSTEKMMRARDIARVLQISLAAAYGLIQSGMIPSYRWNKTVRVTQRDFQEFLEKSRFGNSADQP